MPASLVNFVPLTSRIEMRHQPHCRSFRRPIRIDAVVNNVGLVRPQTLEQVTLDAVLDVNLRTAIRLTQAALTGMREQGWSRVVNIASLVALGAPAAHRVSRGQGGTDQLHPGVGVRECLRTRDGRACASRRTEEVGSWLGR
jgi:NAD(P)-dependent dehydrogenase (short-subunit alcohol dehydrogenase family)